MSASSGPLIAYISTPRGHLLYNSPIPLLFVNNRRVGMRPYTKLTVFGFICIQHALAAFSIDPNGTTLAQCSQVNLSWTEPVGMISTEPLHLADFTYPAVSDCKTPGLRRGDGLALTAWHVCDRRCGLSQAAKSMPEIRPCSRSGPLTSLTFFGPWTYRQVSVLLTNTMPFSVTKPPLSLHQICKLTSLTPLLERICPFLRHVSTIVNDHNAQSEELALVSYCLHNRHG